MISLQAKIQARNTLFLVFVFSLLSLSAEAQRSDIVGSVSLEVLPSASTGISIGAYNTPAPASGETSSQNSQNGILIWLVANNQDRTSEAEDSELKVLDQVDKRFQPRLIGIREGDMVRIKNSDPVYHNVFSLSKTKRFNVGRRSPNDFKDITFNRTGTVDVFCDIHSDMHAVIQVFPAATISWQKLADEGTFRFSDIPEGNYTLHFFALGDRREQIQVEVSGSETINIEPVRLGGR